MKVSLHERTEGTVASVRRKMNMSFRDLEKITFVEYRGRSYTTWNLEISPYTSAIFADIKLEEALRENGDIGNWIDDRIAFYVSERDDVDSAIEQYNQ